MVISFPINSKTCIWDQLSY